MRGSYSNFKRLLAMAIVMTPLFLNACGGGGGGGSGGAAVSAPPAVVNQMVGGIWKGQITDASGNTSTSLTIVTEDGRFFTAARNNNNNFEDLGMGTLAVTGNTVSGNATVGIVVYATSPGVQIGCVYSDGSRSAIGTIAGSVVQRSSLNLTVTATTVNGTALPSIPANLTFDTRYNMASSLAAIAGNWNGPTGNILNINANGAIFSQDPVSGCVVNGQVSIINAAYNAYSASATYSNCGGSSAILNGLSANGILAIDTTVSPNLLYAGYSLTLPNATVLMVAAVDSR